MTHRVAVTGIGIVSPVGIGREAFWNNINAGTIGIGSITRFPTEGYRSRIAGQINDFEPADFIGAKRLRWTDRFSQFALAATRMAVDDAHLTQRGDEIATFIGSALGGLAYADAQHDVFRTEGLDAVRPLLAISVFGGAATCNVALEFGFTGPNVANGNSCASGTVAIGDAFRAVARGDARVAVAGAAEAPLSPLIFGAFSIIRAMSTRNDDPTRASRPFDSDRDGFVMAEGAAMFVLERLDDARERGAYVYGEIAGYGLTNDAHHMSAPHPDGLQNAAAMRRALAEARVDAADVDAINAHGSGTILGDRGESLAIRSVFGARDVPVTGSKGQTGHALGASGAWETALALLALDTQHLPRTINSENPDPTCAIAIARDTPHDLRLRTIVKNSAGFGGINAALVIRQAGTTTDAIESTTTNP